MAEKVDFGSKHMYRDELGGLVHTGNANIIHVSGEGIITHPVNKMVKKTCHKAGINRH